eukprot:TRINITY_DN17299_c0_g1_i1.p1 TRINITY_DN17299_c0_g1~~TRINITY_DN17299_c0_g1_i1.p1  ORF type:complete len:272 (+),score=45.22 TRINITY_DN17299_c0_g1_i1:78-893(+)
MCIRDSTTMVDVEFTETDPLESASGVCYVKVVFRMFVSRKTSVWLWNIIFPLTMITSVSLTQFAIDASDVADRLAVTATILLAIVALKFTVSDRLPDIPYLTTLDVYLFACMMFTILVAFEAAFLSMWKHDHEIQRGIDTTCEWIFTLGWIFVNLMFYAEIAMRNRMLKSGFWVERGWGHGRVWRRFTNVWTTVRKDPNSVYDTFRKLDLNGDGVISEEEFALYSAATNQTGAPPSPALLERTNSGRLGLAKVNPKVKASQPHSAREREGQ